MSGNQAPKVAAGKVVGIYYTLKNEAGEVLDTNRKGGKPLSYLHGSGNILPGLENALTGKAKNDALSIELSPADGYGERDPEAVRDVARSAFPADAEIEEGMVFTGHDDDGHTLSVRVVAVLGDVVTVDHNHPLAGERLFFDVTIAGVRDSTPEEVAHGHPHGPDGHGGHGGHGNEHHGHEHHGHEHHGH